MKLVGTARALADRALATVPGRVVRRLGEDQGPTQAVVIAWNFLFSMFPILLAAAAVLGFLLSWAGVRSETIYATALDVLPQDPASRAQTIHALDGVRQQSGLLFLAGFAGLLWSGSSLFGAMEQAFDLIFHVGTRDFIHQKLMGFGMMLLFTVLAGVAVGTSAVLPLLGQVPGLPNWATHSATVYVLQPLLGIVSAVVLFGAMYYVVPNRRQRLRNVWPGALLAGVAFYALTLVFPLYLSVNRGINQYGANFAFLFVLMNFFYFLGLITMVGVELNAVLFETPAPAPKPEPAARRPEGRRAPALPAAPPRPPAPAGHRRGPVPRFLYAVLAAAIGLFAISRRPHRLS